MSERVSDSGAAAVNGNGANHLSRQRAEALRADILQTRAELGRTVEALAAKADVKARVAQTADEAKLKARETVRRAGQPVPIAVMAAGVLAIVAIVVLRRRFR